MRRCPGLTEAEIAFGEKIHSIGFSYAGGREQFHGTTIKEQEREIFAKAKQYGNEPPEYLGPRSKGRSLSSMKAELV